MIKKVMLGVIIAIVSLFLLVAAGMGILIETKSFHATVEGRITDNNERPIHQAKVHLYIGGSDGSENRFECITNENGEYSIRTPVLRYALDSSAAYRAMSIDAQGYIPVSVERRILKGNNSNWNFQLTESISVNGSVVNTRGEPIADCTLWFLPLEQSNIASYLSYHSSSVTTDNQGKFSLSSIGPFQYRILRDKYGTQIYRQSPVNRDTVDLSEEANRQKLQIHMNEPYDYAISGRIEDPCGNPLEGVYVWAQNDNFGTWLDTSDQQGEFCIIGLDGLGENVVDLRIEHKSPQMPRFRMEIDGVSLYTDDLVITAEY